MEFDLRLDDKSRMSREVHVRFRESLGVRFPRATRPVDGCNDNCTTIGVSEDVVAGDQSLAQTLLSQFGFQPLDKLRTGEGIQLNLSPGAKA